ncbi:hypothetical protein AMTRI_Chr09g36270 [Amborella trichopoda]
MRSTSRGKKQARWFFQMRQIGHIQWQFFRGETDRKRLCGGRECGSSMSQSSCARRSIGHKVLRKTFDCNSSCPDGGETFAARPRGEDTLLRALQLNWQMT